jgi:hypothetical protein
MNAGPCFISETALTILEQAIAARSIERRPHPSWGDAETYLFSFARSHPQYGYTICDPVFVRLDPHFFQGKSFPRWHYYDGHGNRTLIENVPHFLTLIATLETTG